MCTGYHELIDKSTMVKNFIITLSTQDDREAFLPGETVSGLLQFTLTEAKSYKDIEIKLYGGAQVYWTERHNAGRQSRTTTVSYHSEETYVNEAKILWSSDQSPNGKIGPGAFKLPFEFVIPPHCFGSFQGRVGSIKYALHGLIKTGTLHRNHKVSAPLQVNRLTDINLPHLLRPVCLSKEKQVGFFCFGSDIRFTVSLNRTGFCMGHNLPLTATIENGSSRRIKIAASILRNCSYYAEGNTTGERKKLVGVTTQGIAPHSQQTMTIEDLIVPMVEPSFEGSQIIKMQYMLKVTAVIPWAINSSVIIPITLGNVPLNQ